VDLILKGVVYILEGRKRTIVIYSAIFFAVVAIILIGVGVKPTVESEKTFVEDMTPLADMMMDDPSALSGDVCILKLQDINATEDIVIRFKNLETKEKYFITFTDENKYQKNVKYLLQPGTYKLKITEKGELKLKLREKKIEISAEDKFIHIKFK